jgi:ADP-ribose pyrophosphatase
LEKKIATIGSLFAKSLTADLDEIQRENGDTSRRILIRHPHAVVVIPVIGRNEALMVTQYRYAMGGETMEFPAGKLDPGEEPLAAAHRELGEETGYLAEKMEKLTSFAPSIGYSTEIIHVFKAAGLKPGPRSYDTQEISSVITLSLDKIKAKILSGEIIDGTTILAMAVNEWKGE